jgi:hypothetical protein
MLAIIFWVILIGTPCMISLGFACYRADQRLNDLLPLEDADEDFRLWEGEWRDHALDSTDPEE